MKKAVDITIIITSLVVTAIGMIYSIIVDMKTLSAWSELTKGLAQMNVTIALGYAALVAGIAAALKHAGKFAKHKNDLYGMIKAFVYFIVMNLWMYLWSFSVILKWANIVPFAGSLWAFVFLSKHFLKIIREMLNAEVR